ncbi:universal stress protein [Sagittula stellata]|uniref:Universal stress family protein n=1 Tax=Sagittula stellata (strain ATCC 700073 / DSM 11524 / E-37) TaxID=388399 RepID=A3JXE0_SAGS3|nr:universal stress protein [Sagittula stellata]EBA10176.1 universal stress family protein [Sagittula stellata E-37]
MYRNILVPVVFDEAGGVSVAKVLEVAQRLAVEGATITVLHVVEEVPGYIASYLPTEYIAETRKHLEKRVAQLAEGVPGGVPVVVSGHAARSIVERVERHGVDLVVMASHRPGMQDLLIGSVAAHVVRHVTCAVHVVR